MNWKLENLSGQVVEVVAPKFSDAIAEGLKAGLTGHPDNWYVRVVAGGNQA